jgi:hypothetical protein
MKKNNRLFYAGFLLFCTMTFFYALTQWSINEFSGVNIVLMSASAGFGSASFLCLIDPEG